jgi:hypothetical protein
MRPYSKLFIISQVEYSQVQTIKADIYFSLYQKKIRVQNKQLLFLGVLVICFHFGPFPLIDCDFCSFSGANNI